MIPKPEERLLNTFEKMKAAMNRIQGDVNVEGIICSICSG